MHNVISDGSLSRNWSLFSRKQGRFIAQFGAASGMTTSVLGAIPEVLMRD